MIASFSRAGRGLQLSAVLLAALVLPAVAQADEASDRRAAAVALLDQLHPTDAVNAMMPTIIQQIRLNLTRNDPDLTKLFDGFAPQLVAEGEAAKPELIDKVVDIYAKAFTADELKAITAFYASPPGQKMIATQGPVTAETVAAVREWGTKLATKMNEEARTKLQAPTP
jgi:hypothetical protein